MCDFNFKISQNTPEISGPNVTIDGNYVLWEGTTGEFLKMGDAPGMSVQDAHLFYNAHPMFTDNIITDAITDGQIFNINTQYWATPSANAGVSLPPIADLNKGDFVLLKFDANLAHGHTFNIHTHNNANLFVEGVPLTLIWTTITQDPTTPFAVTGVVTNEQHIVATADQTKITINGHSHGAAAVGSYFLFIWDGVDKWHATGKIRSQGLGTGIMADGVVFSA